MKTVLLSIAFSLLCLGITAQSHYNYAILSTEKLDRGVVAVRQPDGKVFVSWRILRDDLKGESFDVYRNGIKLNKTPLTDGGSFFIDESPLAEDATYEIKGGTACGQFTLCQDAPIGYFPIKLNKPEGGKVPTIQLQQRPSNNGWRWHDTGEYAYTANDATVADVDGDGQYEIILKWDPTNAHDNSHDGYTGPTLLDCYRLNGEQLWRINLGINIRSGAHYTPFIVYDFDGDGRAELMVKTANGTRDSEGRVIGNSVADYRNNAGRILEGPEYISVFDGLTGRLLDTKPYIPERGELRAWGDSKGNRSERYLAGVGYLGGKLPSALFCRGYYTRSVIAAWDWDGKSLKERWTFDTNNRKWQSYAGQGNHNLRIADVDGDGYDEITYGSMAVDHDGRGLYNTGMGHGDAIHLIADPKDDRLYIWDCHENKRDGSDLRDAATGKVIFQIKSTADVGRCMAADIDPTNPGVEMWSADSHGIRNMKGEVINAAKDSDDPQHNNYLVMGGRWLSMNFGIWWDGDLLRELLDRETVSKYNWENRQIINLQRFDGQFNNGTKSNPCLAADILGDWREEVIIRNRESTELRLYVSTIPTPYRINCLMQDIPYRLSAAYQNVGYNQPSEPSYYIGPDKTDYLK
ncbi:rhamnogalacturonan lyase [Prevotella sp. E2-28]|uniref:rhamnogalacturonan lyase n=1 Tax=Prevotella sp. E2-28 TaxID=2913620 RepID=UPI001EDB65C5|nr:rhamnogalacturonan lyase [Prevotella sp. E2-28]UKK54286.1 rhamnogalacturonan lyase [Prevotella sp. E2-28]